MVRLDRRGVSDIVVIASMFIVLVLSSVIILGFSSGGLEATSDRQNELKVSFLYRSLDKIEVRPGISSLEAVAEQVELEDPSIENDYLKSWMENTLKFFVPEGYGIEFVAWADSGSWEITVPYNENASEFKSFFASGSTTFTQTGGNFVKINIRIRLFKLRK